MSYDVDLLASRKHGTLYLGVTNDLVRRCYEHRTKADEGFTSRCGVDKLVVRSLRRCGERHHPRKAVEEMAPRLEDSPGRGGEPGLD